MKIQHKTYGYDFDLPEILQGALEIWEKEIEGITIGDIRLNVFSGMVLRAGIKAGWIPAEIATLENVSQMNPGKVVFLSRRISEAVRQAREIPPD